MRIIVGGITMEGYDEKRVAQTFQVNNITNLQNREASHTNQISFPRTSKNIEALDYLSLQNNSSTIPYEKRLASIISENGIPFVHNGWIVINEITEKDIKATIYSGIIGFFKKIELLKLNQLDLSEINHIKNVQNVVDTFDNSKPYKYIVADYGGRSTYVGNISTDYMVPSVKCSYLWDKILAYTGYTYVGAIFSSLDFTNWFISYPKPISTTNEQLILINTQSIIMQSIVYNTSTALFLRYVPIFINTITPSLGLNLVSNNKLITTITGAYKFTASGSYYTKENELKGDVTWSITRALNSLNTGANSGVINGIANEAKVIQLDDGDVITFKGSKDYYRSPDLPTENLIFKVEKINGYNAGFFDSNIEFSIKDFVKEVLQRFSLTVYVDEDKKEIEFKTLSDVISNTDVKDWSKKFQKVTSEKYTIGNYAKRNNFKNKHNEELETTNDGFIEINNENLSDELTVIQSKIYTHEKVKSLILGNFVNTYKMWDKKIKDDNTIEYKELTGRYYFLRSNQKTQSVTFKSDILGEKQTVTDFPIESYFNLGFPQIIQKYYKDIETIFDKAKVIQVLLYLTDVDVASFKFKSTIYLKQLQSYYLVNQISNYIKGKSTKVELVEVDYKKQIAPPIAGSFINITSSTNNLCLTTINFNTDIPFPFDVTITGVKNGSLFNQTQEVVSGIVVIDLQPQTNESGDWSIILQYNNVISNTLTVNNSATCVYIPTTQQATFITITSISNNGIINGWVQVRVNFITDGTFPLDIVGRWGRSSTISFEGIPQTNYGVMQNYIIIQIPYQYIPIFGYNRKIKIQIGAIDSNVVIFNLISF